VQHVCFLVARRAARLVAAAIAGILRHQGKRSGEVGVGVDGSVFLANDDFTRLGPPPKGRASVVLDGRGFDGWVQDALRTLVPDVKVTFLDATDGSGVGAAVTAAVAAKQHQQHHRSH
jgi:hexokinase